LRGENSRDVTSISDSGSQSKKMVLSKDARKHRSNKFSDNRLYSAKEKNSKDNDQSFGDVVQMNAKIQNMEISNLLFETEPLIKEQAGEVIMSSTKDGLLIPYQSTNSPDVSAFNIKKITNKDL